MGHRMGWILLDLIVFTWIAPFVFLVWLDERQLSSLAVVELVNWADSRFKFVIMIQKINHCVTFLRLKLQLKFTILIQKILFWK